MNQNDANFKSFLPYQRWFKITLSSCFWVILTIIFVGQLYNHLPKNSGSHSHTTPILQYSVENAGWTSQIVPCHIPFDAAQHSMDECSSTDDEINDDVDDNISSSMIHDIPEDIYQAAYVENFSIVAYTFPKLKSIPFFILYHAWKSNLA